MTKQKINQIVGSIRGLYRDYCIYSLYPTNFLPIYKATKLNHSSLYRSSILFNLGYLRMDKRT